MHLKPSVPTSIAKSPRRRLVLRVCFGAIVLVALMALAVSLALAVSPSFSDVPESHPYRAGILDLATRGIINGYPDGTFRPDNPVIRQQFAKMVVKTLGYPVSDADISFFTDVPKSLPGSYLDPSDPNYPDHYVAVTAAHGITIGKTATTFDPYGNITHQQLITMIVRAAALPDPPASYTPPFTSGQFSLDEHYLNARKAAYAGLLAGLQGVGPAYSFLAPSTRGECAQLLHNLIDLLTPPTTTTTTSSSTTTTTEVTTTTTSSSTTTTTTAPPAFEKLGGVFTESPAVSSWASGRLDVFVRGTNTNLMHRWWSGGWSGWENLGGVLQAGSSPAAVSWGPNRIDVLIRGTDNELWNKWWNGTVWTP